MTDMLEQKQQNQQNPNQINTDKAANKSKFAKFREANRNYTQDAYLNGVYRPEQEFGGFCGYWEFNQK